MTNQEAIKTIKLAMAQVEWEYPLDYAVAFTKAVDALEKSDKYRWHDLRKDQNDLPEKYEDVYVCVLNRGKKTYNRTWFDGLWRNATSKKPTYYVKTSVIAWRYIEPFEEVE